MATFAGFIAGFAFFLVGIKLFSANINQLTSKRFQLLVKRFTPNDYVAALWGIVLSLLTAGNTVLTPCITAGFESIKAINFRKAIQIVLWSRVGSCAFIYIAGFNIKVLILFMLGIAGLSFALKKPRRYVSFASAVFDLGLVLFGIQQIKSSTKLLVHYEWFDQMTIYAQEVPEVAFFIGVLFLICAQSLFGGIVVALSLLDSQIFNSQQATLFLYGAYLGEAILKIFYLSAFKGVFKRVMSLLPLIYFVTFFMGISSYICGRYFDLPSIESIAHYYARDVKQEIAHINFGVHLLATLLMSFGVLVVQNVVCYFFARQAGSDEDKLVHIPEEVLHDPVMTLSLIRKEQIELIKKLPLYISQTRSSESLKDPLLQTQLHENLHENLQILRDVFSDILHNRQHNPEISQSLVLGIEKHNLLISLEENLFEFVKALDHLREATKDNLQLSEKFLNFAEAMDATLLSMIDLFQNPKEEFNVRVLEQITSSREEFMKKLREDYSSDLDINEKLQLIQLINLFETNVWIMHKIARIAVDSGDD